ncbi:MAG: hypothetical protein Kow006_11050 [Gammaproteobacteria bacterium]
MAGFQYHDGEAIWEQLRVGQRLHLQREPDNRHDRRAVRIDWQGRKLGYLPRAENAAVSQMLERGVPRSLEMQGEGGWMCREGNVSNGASGFADFPDSRGERGCLGGMPQSVLPSGSGQ